MDKEFQTTFIPKQPLTKQKVKHKRVSSKKPFGIFVAVAVLIFIITALISVGVYFYKNFLDNQIRISQRSLERAEQALTQPLILELQKLDTQLTAAETLLSRHVAVSPIFRILEGDTLKSVQYDTFRYDLEGNEGKIALTGLARRYQTIAEQSLLFGENRFVSDHIFSDFTLNDEGRVAFNLDLTISPDLIYFTRSLKEFSIGAEPEAMEEMLPEIPIIEESVFEEPVIEAEEVPLIPQTTTPTTPIIPTEPVNLGEINILDFPEIFDDPVTNTPS